MKLFKIELDNVDYDNYDSCIIVAESELRTTLKSGGFLFSLQRLNLHNQLTSNRLCSD